MNEENNFPRFAASIVVGTAAGLLIGWLLYYLVTKIAGIETGGENEAEYVVILGAMVVAFSLVPFFIQKVLNKLARRHVKYRVALLSVLGAWGLALPIAGVIDWLLEDHVVSDSIASIIGVFIALALATAFLRNHVEGPRDISGPVV